MKLKWLGHAAFLITASDGTRIITDPYTTGGPLSYAPINEPADIVTISHDHGDHNNAASVKGKPQVLKDPGTTKVKGVTIKGVGAYHDTEKGAQRGTNTVFNIVVDGVHIVHLGDLGHILDANQVKEVGQTDILLTPVGGTWALDGKMAAQVASDLKAKVVVPMHTKNPHCSYPIAEVEPFLKGRSNVRRENGSEVEFTKADLPKATQTISLRPAL